MKILCLILALICSDSHAAYFPPPDLSLTCIPRSSDRIMILAHGMAANYRIHESAQADCTLVSFNFPDHDLFERRIPYEKTTFGTFDELIPLLYTLKKVAVTDRQPAIDLYGFSAGGGAMINALAVLNTNRFDPQLAKLDISLQDKSTILQAVQKGIVLLDVPLKSIQELIDLRGKSKDLLLLSKRYRQNDMEPIEALKYLKGLKLHVILHFQDPDEVLFNRDDDLYFERLKSYNPDGINHLLISNEGGHKGLHQSLWNFYKSANSKGAESNY